MFNLQKRRHKYSETNIMSQSLYVYMWKGSKTKNTFIACITSIKILTTCSEMYLIWYLIFFFQNFRPSKSRMEAINEIIARSQTQAQNMLAAGGYFEETLRSITTPRNANYNYHDGSPDTSIASDFSFNSVSPAVMATYPSQAKSPRK